jgi:predicted glycogen debranching enzyme
MSPQDMGPEPLDLGRDVLASLESSSRREWLVTNGLGGYAAGTVAGMNTRRYHGLLVAALKPPVERRVLVAQLDTVVTHRGERTELGVNEFAGGYVHPQGWRYLHEFRREGAIPVWRWTVGDLVIERRVWMAHGHNTTYVQFTVVAATEPVELELLPLCADRDYHWHHRGAVDYRVATIAHGVELQAHDGATHCRLLCERGEFRVDPAWYWNFHHRVEAERGLDADEDLYRPGVFRMRLGAGETSALILTAETAEPRPAPESYAAERSRQQELLSVPGSNQINLGLASRQVNLVRTRHPLRHLLLAADQFIVERRASDGRTLGHSVIAGYPWFSDWGRDTMLALPGLTLATGRPELASSILRTFAQFVSDGMLPNRFPDAGETPEYNTVDATLWYFVAIEQTWRHTRDRSLLDDLFPVLREIVAAHERGTRYQIRVDQGDGLLYAGEPGVQLTWMDAKVGDWVVTPRLGKPVEINALWFNALSAMRDFAVELGDERAARDYLAKAERAGRSFADSFWYEAGGYLFDVIDGPEGELGTNGRRRDASLRPNQVLAVSLPHPLLDNGRAKSIVDICARHLWTPLGLRSLAPRDPRYVGHYAGGPRERDAAYHQGTVWSWLAGPFALAHYRVYGDVARAKELLAGLTAHLREACIGQLSEIHDGDAPHLPHGCFAQAWSVAETLRAWRELDECEAQERHGAPRRRRRKLTP